MQVTNGLPERHYSPCLCAAPFHPDLLGHRLVAQKSMLAPCAWSPQRRLGRAPGRQCHAMHHHAHHSPPWRTRVSRGSEHPGALPCDRLRAAGSQLPVQGLSFHHQTLLNMAWFISDWVFLGKSYQFETSRKNYSFNRLHLTEGYIPALL